MAKEVYQNVVQGAIEVKNAGRPYLGAGNMSVDELIVGSIYVALSDIYITNITIVVSVATLMQSAI